MQKYKSTRKSKKWRSTKSASRDECDDYCFLLDVKGTVTTGQWQVQIRWLTTTTTSTSVQKWTVYWLYTHPDVPAMAWASWLEALSRSTPLLASHLPHSQLCTSPDERSQFHRSHDTFSTVTVIRPRWASPSSWLEPWSRSQSKTAGGRSTATHYCAQFHEFLFWRATRFQLCWFNSWALKTPQALSSRRHFLQSALFVGRGCSGEPPRS